MQVIYLQDCGSTHGTYIDKKRLEAGVEYVLADGEVITFGQRVTSGAGGPSSPPTKASKMSVSLLNLYSHIPSQRIPCSFEVGSSQVGPLSLKTNAVADFYSDVPDSYSTANMRAQRLVYMDPISRPAFTSDFDHSSEPSREGSVQISESHRHTFSVPSSDDEVDSEDEEDEVQIASSVQSDEEEGSAATTPDRQAVGKAYSTKGEAQSSKIGPAPGEIRSLNLKGPTLQNLLTKTAKDGTSQDNPINLEGVCASVIDVDTESEDDGPDVLPFNEVPKAERLDQDTVYYKSQVSRQTSAVARPPMITVAEKQGDLHSETREDRIVPETQVEVHKGGGVSAYDPTNVLAESTAGATDDFSSEDDDGHDYYDHELFDDENFEPFREPSVLDVGTPSSSKPKVTFQIGSENPHYQTLTPPFDEIRPTRLGHLLVSDPIDVSQPSEPSSMRAQRAPSPSDAALAKKANDPKTSLGRHIYDSLPEPIWPAAAKTTCSQSTDHALDNAASHEEHIGAYSWPELQSPEPRSYDQGPFSSQPQVIVPTGRSPKPNKMENQSKKATVTWVDAHQENDDMIMSIDRSAWIGKQSSKITIPSLVENYLAENSGSLRRRPGAMNGSNDFEVTPDVPKSITPVTRTSGYKRTFAECSYEEEMPGTTQQSHVDHSDSMWESGEDKTTHHQLGIVDRDSPLNDAQPRDNIFQTPTASMSQDSDPEPVLGSVSIPTTIQDDGTEGPARKKAKTSSSSSGGLGKFVMGVGFGLLGAAAAFVATIPASVYEEALREFNNAA